MRLVGWLVFILALTLAGIFGLIDFAAIVQVVATHPHIALECFALVVLSFAFVALRMAALLKVAGIHITYYESLKITMLSQFYGNILIGPIGAEVTKFSMLVKKSGHRYAELTTILLLDRVFGLSGLVCVVLFMSFLATKVSARVPYHSYVTAGFLSVLMMLIALFLIHKHLSMKTKYAVKEFIKSRAPSLHKILSQLGRGFRTFKLVASDPLILCKVVGFSVMASLLPLIGFWEITKATLPNVFDFYSSIMILAITILMNSMGITPGGIGVGEGVFALLCFLVTGDSSLPYIETFLTIRLISIMCVLPGGGFLLRPSQPEKKTP